MHLDKRRALLSGGLPVIVVGMVIGIGTWGLVQIEQTLRTEVTSKLATVRDGAAVGISLWLDDKERVAHSWANEPDVRKLVAEQIVLAESGATPSELQSADSLTALRNQLRPICEDFNFIGFVLVNAAGVNIGALLDEPIGLSTLNERSDLVRRAFDGETLVTPPFPAAAALPDAEGTMHYGQPTMFAASPVLDTEGNVIATLAFRIRPEDEFTSILNIGRLGKSGETYAFNNEGLMLSKSRFEAQLLDLGLVRNEPGENVILKLRLTDPELDPQAALKQAPFTLAVRSAIEGNTATNASGYRNYRGIPVVGAWTWLPQRQFGVATELEFAEAYAGLVTIRRAVLAIVGLLLISTVIGTRFVVLNQRHTARLVHNERAMQEVLRELEMQKYALDQSAIVTATDVRGIITYANDTFCEISGYSREELLGQNHRMLKSDEHSLKFFKNMWRTIARGNVFRGEIKNRRKDGSFYWVYATIVPLTNAKGKPKQYIGIRVDITERKLNESRMHKLTEELRNASRATEAANQELEKDLAIRESLESELVQAQKLEAIGQLAAGIAHEINTPTQFIGDNTRFLEASFQDISPLLKMANELAEAIRAGGECTELADDLKVAFETADVDYLDDEIPRAIGQSLEGIDRVRKIVKSMKDFSHPGSDTKVGLDINRAIESTATVASNEWKYVAELKLEFDEDLPQVPCLAGELNQTILNIIVNAAHAITDVVNDGAEGKGTITIRTRRDREFAEIRITDTGTGIPEDVRHRIFDPFFTTKEVGKGTGQGLSIAYKVVTEKHGGTIDCESEIGKGTTFIIRLPLTDSCVESRPSELATA